MTGDQTAACAGNPEPLWDAHLDGESDRDQSARHARAVTICRRCPMRRECAAGIDPKHDDGVRGGRVLPTIPDRDRRSPYVDGIPPENEGRVPIGDPALLTCGECGRSMVPKSIPRHRRRWHAGSRQREEQAA